MTFTTKINWENEIESIKQKGKMGSSMVALANHYGVTRQRMKQVIDRYIPVWKNEYGSAVNRKREEDFYTKKWGVREDSALYEEKRKKLRNKKASAIAQGVEWDLHFGDLTWPTHCPVLGIELNYFAEKREEASVSFDRLDSNTGYVIGNVKIMSWRANRIKNDGTAEEHRSIAAFLDKNSS